MNRDKVPLDAARAQQAQRRFPIRCVHIKSRRLANQRMKRELRVRLKYPTPQTLFAEVAPRALKKQLALPLGAAS